MFALQALILGVRYLGTCFVARPQNEGKLPADPAPPS